MFKDFGISEADWNATPQSVKIVVGALQHQERLLEIRFTAYEKKFAALEAKDAELENLKTEVAALRERLGQNSANSSQPPSSDSPRHRCPSHREPSGKKQGAQLGYQGAGRSLKPAAEVDRVIDFRPERCRSCGRRLKGYDPTPTRHQVTETPSAQTGVTEYRRHTLCCEACGEKTQAAWSEDVPPGSFGARLQATVAYLTGRLGLSHRDCVQCAHYGRCIPSTRIMTALPAARALTTPSASTSANTTKAVICLFCIFCFLSYSVTYLIWITG